MEYSEDLLIFDLMHVRLLHGWCVDPQDKTTARVVGHLTYNQLVEKVIELSSPARPGPPATAAHPRAAPTARPAADGLDDEELQAALKLSMQPRTPPPSPPPSPPFSRRRTGSNAAPAPAAAAPADAAAAPASVAPSPPPSPPASSPSAVASTTDALIAQEWLQTSANQLTYHGLEKLHCGCNHELAIISMQSSACNHQHAIISMQSSACSHELATTSTRACSLLPHPPLSASDCLRHQVNARITSSPSSSATTTSRRSPSMRVNCTCSQRTLGICTRPTSCGSG